MSETIKSFRDLRIWQKGMELVEKIYKVTGQFPKAETYGLAAQMQRASVSIPSNVAEGFRRRHPREYKQYLNISLGSCGELETQIEIAKRLGYVGEKVCEELVGEIEYVCKMIHTLVKTLVSSLTTHDPRLRT